MTFDPEQSISRRTSLHIQMMRDRLVCLLLDQIKREKGVWWMPWQ